MLDVGTKNSAVTAKSGLERIQAELRRLSRVYSDERVLTITVRTSRRLSASLARAHLARADVVLAEALLDSRHLEEVVTHEVAHVVCWWRHGRVRPHGPAWRQLVIAAGQAPTVRMLPRDIRLPDRRPNRRRARRLAAAALHGFLRSLL